MMTTEQQERLLGQVVSGVALETAMEALGISELDLTMRCQADEAFRISLDLAEGVRSEFSKRLFEEIDPQ